MWKTAHLNPKGLWRAEAQPCVSSVAWQLKHRAKSLYITHHSLYQMLAHISVDANVSFQFDFWVMAEASD